MSKKLVLTTGPSKKQKQVHAMIEKYFGWNYVYVDQNDSRNLDEWIDRCDLLLIAGGADVFPQSYNRQMVVDENMDRFDRERDIREIYIIKQMIKRKKPISGICRALQLYSSVFLELDLVDLKSYKDATICHHPYAYKIDLSIDEDPFCHRIYFNNGKSLWVNSHHGMGILMPKDMNTEALKGVEIIAHADMAEEDLPKIVEWVKDSSTNANFVQFHPELAYKTNEASQIFLNELKEMVG